MSIRDSMDPSRMVSEVRHTRETQPEATFLLVEGSKDISFYRRYTAKPPCEIWAFDGKENVCEAVNNVNRAGLSGVIGIIDSDFSKFLPEPIPKNVFRTDSHDMETMLISSEECLPKLMDELVDFEKLEEYDSSHTPGLVERIFSICEKTGKMRILQLKYPELHLDFSHKGLYITNYIDKEFDFDDEGYLKEVAKASGSAGREGSVLKYYREELERARDRWHICRGHDLTEVFSYAFSRNSDGFAGGFPGVGYPRRMNSNEIERFLRLAYDTEEFYGTKLYAVLKAWQDEHKKTRVLKEE